MRRIRPLIGLLATSLALSPAGAAAKGNGAEAIQVVLDGARVTITGVSRFHCHDRDGVTLMCFRSERARDADLATGNGGDGADSVAYVRMFADENYGGGSLTLTQPVSDLGVYIWNDVTTSFKSLNGGRPKFWADVGYTNGAWQWPTGAWVANVGSGANDQFSSVKNVP